MFQYTKDVILHGVADRVFTESGVYNYSRPEETGTTTRLVIKRVGEYFANSIVGPVYKTEAVEGNPGELTIDLSNIFTSTDDSTDKDSAMYPHGIAGPGLYQLSFRMKTPNQFYAEFANPAWKPFGQPILVGFEVSEAESKDANAVAKRLVDLINLTMASDNRYMEVSPIAEDDTETKKVVIKGNNNYMTFDKVVLEKYDPTVCDSCLGEYNVIADVNTKIGGTNVFTIVKNNESFGTGKWIQENLRFPTYANIRYESPNADETPVIGAKYVQYSFAYASPRPGFGGQSGVGQGMSAVTRHIFYVLETEATELEYALAECGLTGKIKDGETETTYDFPTRPSADTEDNV